MKALFSQITVHVLSVLIFLPVVCSADTVKTTLGGQIKTSFSAFNYDSDSIQSEFKDDPWLDSDINLRIKARTFFSDNLSLDCHYVLEYHKGDSTQASNLFETKQPDSSISQIFRNNFDSDDTKLMDLSSKIKEGDDSFTGHSLDRLNLSLDNDFGRVVIGRQAVTWGNGILFNPMDIFNPFSPYDTQRDYKRGDDMAYLETFFKKGDDLQFIYVPRRDARDGNVKFSESSIGFKYHFFPNNIGIDNIKLDNMEFDFMVAEHYEDNLAGIGYAGTIGNAVVRSDLIYTFAGGDTKENFLNFIANIDYSWEWFKKNLYGFIEYYYSGLGVDDYSKALTDPDLSERINRGELYGFGKNYLSSGIQIELNPLLNFNFTAIANLNDPSFLLQPGITWDAAQNIEITVSSNLTIGGKGDEYGQIQIPSSTESVDRGSSLFLWITMFF